MSKQHTRERERERETTDARPLRSADKGEMLQSERERERERVREGARERERQRDRSSGGYENGTEHADSGTLYQRRLMSHQ